MPYDIRITDVTTVQCQLIFVVGLVHSYMAMYTARYAGGSDATILIATSIGIDAILAILFCNG